MPSLEDGVHFNFTSLAGSVSIDLLELATNNVFKESRLVLMAKFLLVALFACSISSASHAQTNEQNRTSPEQAKQTKSPFEVGDVVRLKSG
jgi:hypothetical protein